MKKLSLFLTLVFAAILSHAQVDVKSSGNVAIGNANPNAVATHTLDVYGDAFIRCKPASCGLWFENYNNSGTDDPIIKPQWTNWAWLGNNNFRFWRVYSHEVWSTGFNPITSDQRLKTNIQPMGPALAKISLLNPVTYDMNIPYDEKNTPESRVAEIKESGQNQVGLLAQEVEKVYPEAVVYDKENDVYAIKYSMLIPVLIKAIQEQQKQIDELKKNDR